MLLVRTTELTAKPLEWHIGDNTEAINDAADAGRIQYVKASGEERKRIIGRCFGAIRININDTTTTWYGEDARFIAGNL